jgi:hypothetical protein
MTAVHFARVAGSIKSQLSGRNGSGFFALSKAAKRRAIMYPDQIPFRYRNRADAIRDIAGTTLDTTTRRLLLEVAEGYESVAETLERISATEGVIDRRREH